ncbi:MAG TPA: hypothetical protein VF469_40210 [Kofleriaceae bacterium]
MKDEPLQAWRAAGIERGSAVVPALTARREHTRTPPATIRGIGGRSRVRISCDTGISQVGAMQDFYEEEHTEILARVVWARKRPCLPWLFGAGLSFAVGVALTMSARRATHIREHETALAIEHGAAEIGRAIDAAARSAHQRVDRVANTAMMRAAILTDAATVADLLRSEFKLGIAPGEIIELFQLRGANLETLIRWPTAAAALPVVTDPSVTIVHLDGAGPRVAVGAHIDRLKDGDGYDASISGAFVLSTPVDLQAIGQRLSEYATEATLAESGRSVQLVHRSSAVTGDLVELAVPSRMAQLTLTVAPAPPTGHGGWIAAARNAAFALGGVMLIVFGLVFMSRRSPARG